MEGARASADEDALRGYLEQHPMPQRRSEEEGEEESAGAGGERDAEERRVQRHLLGTMMEGAGPFPFERALREMEQHDGPPAHAHAGPDHAEPCAVCGTSVSRPARPATGPVPNVSFQRLRVL